MVEPDAIPPTSTFVIRWWKEYSSSETYWRGWIKHIQSGQQVTFQDARSMLHFMRSFGISCLEEDDQSEKVIRSNL